jgi:GntR family transcriptional regulator, phosphonate transport system regulatory protein
MSGRGTGRRPDPPSAAPLAHGSRKRIRWQTVAADLAEDIRSGRLAPGERLPKETDLATKLGLSRHSLRRTLSELARHGLIEVTPRIGARVLSLRLRFHVSADDRFNANVEMAGRRAGTVVLSVNEVIAPPEVAALLGVAKRTPAIELYTLRTANDVPLALMRAWLPADRFARVGELFQSAGGYTAAYAKLGIHSHKRTSTLVTARSANAEERRRLDLKAGATVLVSLTVDVDAQGEPINVNEAVFAAERTEFQFNTPPGRQ